MEKREKRAYDTQEEAESHLRHIVETCKKPWLAKNKKPIRCYFQDGKWFLTSKPQIKIY